MGRNKKRLLARKKKPIKRVVKHVSKPDGKTSEGKTSEQKAREVEMLKTMLMRQQPAAGVISSQQTDKEREKLDKLNRLVMEKTKEAETIKKQSKEYMDALNNADSAVRDAKSETAQQQRLNKINQDKINALEVQRRRQQELADEKARIQQRLTELEGKGTNAEQLKEIDQLKEKERQLDLQAQQLTNKINENKMYGELEKQRHATETAETYVESLKAKIESADFKRPSEALVDLIRREMKAKDDREFYEHVMNKRKEINETEAEAAAFEQYTTMMTQYVPVLNKDGTQAITSTGRLRWEKEKSGGQEGDYVIDKSKSLYATRTKEMAGLQRDREAAELRLRKAKIESDDVKAVLLETTETKIALEKTKRELMAQTKYQESAAFRDSVKELEEKRELIAKTQAQNEAMKQNIAQQKQIRELAARNDVLATFDPSQTEPDAIQAQIQEFSNQVIKEWEDQGQKQLERIEHDKLRQQLQESVDQVVGKYETSYQQAANNKLMELVAHKTNNQLPADMLDYDIDNMRKATQFIDMIGKANPDILTDEKAFNAFVASSGFTDFDWQPMEEVLQ